MNFVEEIKTAFTSKNIIPIEHWVEYYHPDHFGDYNVTLVTEVGQFRIIQDKGQIYIDYYINNEFIPIEKIIGGISNIYLRSNWKISDLIDCIASNKKHLKIHSK